MWAFVHGDSWTGMPKASASEHSVFAKQSWVFKSRNAQAQKKTQDLAIGDWGWLDLHTWF
jgi:hypothetical protein